MNGQTLIQSIELGLTGLASPVFLCQATPFQESLEPLVCFLPMRLIFAALQNAFLKVSLLALPLSRDLPRPKY